MLGYTDPDLVGLPGIYRYLDRKTKRRCVPVQVHADETDVFCRGGRIGYDLFGFGNLDKPFNAVIINNSASELHSCEADILINNFKRIN